MAIYIIWYYFFLDSRCESMRPTLIFNSYVIPLLGGPPIPLHIRQSTAKREEAANSSFTVAWRMSGESSRIIKTCDTFPSSVLGRRSPGPDCCKKTCANVTSDPLNCGGCGRKCRYGQTCCGGSCVNVVDDPSNCGECGKRCRKGSFCRYGLCGYAK
ncbi:hypothetical protein HPP92_004984 [Vanilla planifolia]|uniref:Stigma-specific STIG1-like protein 1 n=1 Tax=Vanilla planifolia TaxID=51239 RepID=A0A835VEG5_VANPL|nr:hypothetical protein HPP92_004984 [Vanilla planifolia]